MNRNSHAWTVGTTLLLCVFMVGMIGCKEDPPLSSIEVSNECGTAIDVYMDGIFQFFLEYGFIKTVKDVEWGTYMFEARRNSTGELVNSEALSVRVNEILKWRVWSSADIKVTNNYGQKLRIFGDNVYVGELEDQTSSFMDHVPYGDRKLEARLSDDTVVVSTTISIQENIVYEWKIEK